VLVRGASGDKKEDQRAVPKKAMTKEMPRDTSPMKLKKSNSKTSVRITTNSST
jgi:hypothetical protein